MFDGGLLGGARLGWPKDCAEDDVPAWLVFGVMLRAADMAQVDEVQSAAGVSLMGEGFQMVETDAIVESFARHLMTAFDKWNERGFEPIARDYLERLPKSKAGERRGIDVNGDLLTSLPQSKGAPQRTGLVEALATRSVVRCAHAAQNSDERVCNDVGVMSGATFTSPRTRAGSTRRAARRVS